MQNILAEADLKSQQLARRAHVNMENMPREVIAAILERLEAVGPTRILAPHARGPGAMLAHCGMS